MASQCWEADCEYLQPNDGLVVAMIDQEKSKKELRRELESARKRIIELEDQLSAYQEKIKRLATLATFPEQNPNLVIEIGRDGTINYLNPVAMHRFPDLSEKGFSHPLLRDLLLIIEILEKGEQDYIAREVDVGTAVFEQKICYIEENNFIRVFAHDITARIQAEEAVRQMAEQLRELTRRVVMAQEEERQRVSRELHDEAGQALTALKISLELIREGLPPDTEELNQNLEEAISLTHTTRHRIRLLALGLHPPVLDTLGLNLALEDLCRDFSKRTKIAIQYRGGELPPQSDPTNVCLYRFLQESLTNAAEHAGATQIWVNLDFEDNYIRLSVQDDGRGINLKNKKIFSQKNSTGLGLLGMKERLRLLDGRLEIDSEVGKGTSVIAYVPQELIA